MSTPTSADCDAGLTPGQRSAWRQLANTAGQSFGSGPILTLLDALDRAEAAHADLRVRVKQRADYWAQRNYVCCSNCQYHPHELRALLDTAPTAPAKGDAQ